MSNAQTEEPVNYNTLQEKPLYPGGIKEFYAFVYKNFRVPELEISANLRIIATFIVERDGSLSDITIVKDPGYGLGEETIRVIKLCPKKWNPGLQNGKPVRARYVLPISVNIVGYSPEPTDSLPAKPVSSEAPKH